MKSDTNKTNKRYTSNNQKFDKKKSITQIQKNLRKNTTYTTRFEGLYAFLPFYFSDISF